MHMVNALISPIVGGAMLAAPVSIMSHSIRKIDKKEFKEKLPLIGIASAFVLSAQRI